MIPMSLENILDGILVDELSPSSPSSSSSSSSSSSDLMMAASLSSDASPLIDCGIIGDLLCTAGDEITSTSVALARDMPSNSVPLVVAEGREADSGAEVPCISIKSELPDSCTVDVMLECADSNTSDESSRSAGFAFATVKGEDFLLTSSPGGGCSSTTTTTRTTSKARCNDDLMKDDDEGPKRICLVCGDVASGFHYGVSSCEACKAFFKRTIQGHCNGGIDYTCPASNDCEINKRRRKSCQSCRYKKCLQMGMLKEGVRLDRVRGGRQKYRTRFVQIADSRYYADDGTPTTAKRRLPSLDENKIFCALKKCEPERMRPVPTATELSVTSKNPNLYRLVANLSSDPTSSSSSSSSKSISQVTTKTMWNVASFYERQLVTTIRWAKQIPGFDRLALSDQMSLLQASWSEIATLTLIYQTLAAAASKSRGAESPSVHYGSICTSSSYPLLSKKLKLSADEEVAEESDVEGLIFSSEFTLSGEMAEKCDLADFHFQSSKVVERAEEIHLREEEYIMLKAVLLCNCSVNLHDKKPFDEMKESVLESFHDCVAVIRTIGQLSTGIQNLLLLLPSIRQADVIVRKFLKDVRSQGFINLNKLLVEMLEAGN